jgi:hypothetical protein
VVNIISVSGQDGLDYTFVSMLSDQELGRQDYAAIQAQLKRERKKAEAAKARVIDIKGKSAGLAPSPYFKPLDMSYACGALKNDSEWFAIFLLVYLFVALVAIF